MNRNGYGRLVAVGFLTVASSACGDDSGDSQLAPVAFEGAGENLSIANHSGVDVDVEVAAVVVCPDVSRSERVDLRVLRLGPDEVAAFPLEADLLDLSKFGNSGECEVTPLASGSQDSIPFALMGSTVLYDAEGVLLDPELDHEPRCLDGLRNCTLRD